MKIDSSYKPSASAISPRAQAAPTAPMGAPQDAVNLSQLAGSLQTGESPPINTARVQEIKQAISEGRFKINPEAIAGRLIDSARELLNGNSKRQA